jgi:parallel beta-helix repeat protein
MKLESAFLMVLLTILVTSLFTALEVQRVEASGTIYIRADGSIEGTVNIQTADNITYVFTADINESIIVERKGIVIDGDNYTVQRVGDVFSSGIYLFDVDNVTVKNINVKDFFNGFCLNSTSHSAILGNNITNNGDGIYLDGSSNSTISGNSITTTTAHGIYLSSSSNNSISGNNITETGQDSIELWNSNYTSISGNDITNSWDGISLGYSSNNGISGNKITNNTYGISLAGFCSDNNISGNMFLNDGLSVEEGYGNVVSDNLVNGKPLVYLDGVSDYVVGHAGQVILVECLNITVESADLSKATVGVQLWGTNNTKIIGNSITGNWIGIYVCYSYNNSIIGNAITDSWRGIDLLYSTGNRIFHNGFVDNSFNTNTEGSTNVWDDSYPSGGNYWGDLAGSDTEYGAGQNLTGSDGICDSYHTIDVMGQKDNYPLMGMFSDFNATTEYHVQTICNSSISDFQFNGTAIRFNVSGENDTSGFCRICIPTALMDSTYKVYVNSTEIQYILLPFSNSTYSYLYFNYTHSTEQVTIVPEFPAISILLLFMVLTLPMISTRRKRMRSGSR